MRVRKVHCLFEQSGTWKNEFRKLGIAADDYDILNNYDQTDHVVDLFTEIKKSYDGGCSILDSIAPDDLVVAFFPCTRFEAFVPLMLRGELIQQKKWDDARKLRYSMKTHEELSENYQIISKMFVVAIEKNIRMIVENPWTSPHYLKTCFPIKPKIVDKDRREMGDYFEKPTQYWFLNCEPEDNLIFEPLEYVQTARVMKEWESDIGGSTREEKRSLMHPQYANRFIRRYILDKEE